MYMIRYLVWAIILYFFIRFVFNFLIPLIRAGRRMKAQMREFQDRMNQQQQFQEHQTQFSTREKQDNKTPAGDYIDFEEIKD